jgi:hypothetical protein
VNKPKDEQWLDNELRRAVDGGRPQFDAEAWKQKYYMEFQALWAKTQRTRSKRPRRLFVRHLGRLVAAAVILVAVGILVTRNTERPGGSATPQPMIQPPVQLVCMLSLTMAYREGGQEAFDQQLDNALKRLGPRPGKLSMAQLYTDFEG